MVWKIAPPKLLGKDAVGKWAMIPRRWFGKGNSSGIWPFSKSILNFNCVPKLFPGPFQVISSLFRSSTFACLRCFCSFYSGKSPWKTHHFWEKYVLGSLDFHSHRFRRVANPSPSKKPLDVWWETLGRTGNGLHPQRTLHDIGPWRVSWSQPE